MLCINPQQIKFHFITATGLSVTNSVETVECICFLVNMNMVRCAIISKFH